MLEELEIINLELKHQKNENEKLKEELHCIKNPSISNNIQNKVKITNILRQADEAMDRFTAKLRKETINAKQKQSKRQ